MATSPMERRTLESATERFAGGLENFLSVLDAQRTLLAARDELVQSETNAVVAVISLYKALGGGWDPEAVGSEPPVAWASQAVRADHW